MGDDDASADATVDPLGAKMQRARIVDATRLRGRVLWFDARKNYGGIQPYAQLPPEVGETARWHLFVHGNDLVEPGGQPPQSGDEVEFCRGACPRGRAKAARVVVTAAAMSAAPLPPPPALQPLPPHAWPRPLSPAAAGLAPAFAYLEAPFERRLLGRVRWFDADKKQYGFLVPADRSPDVFVHAEDVAGARKALRRGDPVEYELGYPTQGGKPRAIAVVRLAPALDDDRRDDADAAPGEEPVFAGKRICGIVARFDQKHNWGFVAPSDPTRVGPPSSEYGAGDHFFLHGADVLDDGDVAAGQAVEFAVVKSRARRFKAVRCVRLRRDDAAPRKALPPPRPEAGQADPFSTRRRDAAAAAPVERR